MAKKQDKQLSMFGSEWTQKYKSGERMRLVLTWTEPEPGSYTPWRAGKRMHKGDPVTVFATNGDAKLVTVYDLDDHHLMVRWPISGMVLPMSLTEGTGKAGSNHYRLEAGALAAAQAWAKEQAEGRKITKRVERPKVTR